MKQRTLLLIKPDAVEARHVGEIISIIQHHGFEICQVKVFRFDPDLCSIFYKDHLARISIRVWNHLCARGRLGL
jgi:nucleoside-diphosphate kinase